MLSRRISRSTYRRQASKASTSVSCSDKAASKLFGGATEFVLSSSGHIQSIINPPGNTKADYFVNANEASDADTWLAGAKRMSGSWWDHWRQWLVERSGAPVLALDGIVGTMPMSQSAL
jgi:poly(3-hydroxyalkanoate) synthetase